ncbi:MAG: hypothetical protein NG747_16200 [Candidatus Brocadia sp.]|nr:hypothetical protein [Candidatus Brocadia sp.]
MASRNEELDSAITMSMVLKFFLHRKHLARLVFGLGVKIRTERADETEIAFGGFAERFYP